MNLYTPDDYQPERLDQWIATARRQAGKDRILIPRIARHFRPGRILELGAGAGQLAQLLRSMGRDVVPSDFAPFFVEHMQRQGLPAVRIDATDIAASDVGRFPNIFCQSISPFITTELEVVARAYRSVLEALEPGGRFVLIHAMASRGDLAKTMRQHRSAAEAAGLQRVRVRREQLLPSVAYARLPGPSALLESAFGGWLGSRFVLTGERAPA